LPLEILSLIIMCLLTAFGQINIKIGAGRIIIGEGPAVFVKSCLNRHLVSGGITTLTAPLFYFYAVARLDLNVAYGFTGLTYILVFCGSFLLLKEKITPYHLGGILLIFIGILSWSRGIS